MTWDYLMTWQHDSCRKFLYVAQLWAWAPSSFVIVIIRMIIATITMNDHGDDDDVDNDDNPDQGQPEICVPMTIDSLPGLFFMSGDWFDLNNRQWHRSKYVYSFVLLCHGSWFKSGSIPTTGSGTDQSTHLSCWSALSWSWFMYALISTDKAKMSGVCFTGTWIFARQKCVQMLKIKEQ